MGKPAEKLVEMTPRLLVALLQSTKEMIEMLMKILEEFKEYNLKKSEIARAAKKAQAEYDRYRADIRRKGEETLKYLEENNL